MAIYRDFQAFSALAFHEVRILGYPRACLCLDARDGHRTSCSVTSAVIATGTFGYWVQ